MDLLIRMTIIYNAKHFYAMHLKFDDKFLTSLTMLVLEAEASRCTKIKGNIFSYYRTFSVLVGVIVI